MVESPLEVLMGCGHPYYDNNGSATSDTTFTFVGGKETWESLKAGHVGNDADADGTPDFWKLVQDRLDFQSLMSGDTPKRIMGIPKVRATLQQSRDGDVNAPPYLVPLNENIPTLLEMTRVALNVLDNDQDGFFLMIEGGAVDWASHGNQSGRMIEEQIAFNKTIEAVVAWVEKNSSWEETLIIITGDHETGYLNGPGSGNDEALSTGGISAVWKPLVNNGKGNLPGMEWHTRGHSNSLIPLYAKGMGSELFHEFADETDPVRGKYVDNTEVGKVMFRLWGE
jgi:alkaline phosphatase